MCLHIPMIFRSNTMVFQEKTVCCSAKTDQKLACFLFGISIKYVDRL